MRVVLLDRLRDVNDPQMVIVIPERWEVLEGARQDKSEKGRDDAQDVVLAKVGVHELAPGKDDAQENEHLNVEVAQLVCGDHGVLEPW